MLVIYLGSVFVFTSKLKHYSRKCLVRLDPRHGSSINFILYYAFIMTVAAINEQIITRGYIT